MSETESHNEDIFIAADTAEEAYRHDIEHDEPHIEVIDRISDQESDSGNEEEFEHAPLPEAIHNTVTVITEAAIAPLIQQTKVALGRFNYLLGRQTNINKRALQGLRRARGGDHLMTENTESGCNCEKNKPQDVR